LDVPSLTRAQTRAVDTQALESLRYIRETMTTATDFTAVSGTGAIVMGVTACAAAWLAHRQRSEASWLVVWLIEAALAFAIGSFYIWRKSVQAGSPLFSKPGRRFMLCYAAPLLAGVVQTIALYRAGLGAFLPGMWLLLYGTAAVAGGASSIRPIRWAGVCFMTLGAAALSSPTTWGDAFMAAGFGVVQIAFGIVIAARYGG
jgi:hypothetical protein